jgi:hypothetical protein
MNDTKNILLAWVSTASSLLALVQKSELVTVISAIVLPVMFFAVGKTVDVLLQLHFRRREPGPPAADRKDV